MRDECLNAAMNTTILIYPHYAKIQLETGQQRAQMKSIPTSIHKKTSSLSTKHLE
jgi:hypothetical protein